MKTVLSIAGSDSSGGAGIQADIKTITAHRLYAMTAVTALTAQNTAGVSGIFEAAPEFVGIQLDSIFTDIIPDSVKIGMVSNKNIIECIAEKLTAYQAKNIVLDPVMISSSGTKLLNEDSINALAAKLIPLAVLITPNIPEAEYFSGMTINSKSDMEKACVKISKIFKGSILIKGGHLAESCDDLLYGNDEFTWYHCEKINNSNTHGTGCTLSSAIACNLAEGQSIRESIKNAKGYLTGALSTDLNLGKGSGPLNHCWNL